MKVDEMVSFLETCKRLNPYNLDFAVVLSRVQKALRAASAMRACISLDIDAYAEPIAYDLDSSSMLRAVIAFDAATGDSSRGGEG